MDIPMTRAEAIDSIIRVTDERRTKRGEKYDDEEHRRLLVAMPNSTLNRIMRTLQDGRLPATRLRIVEASDDREYTRLRSGTDRFARMIDDAEDRVRRAIGQAMARLAEAMRILDEGRVPNTCGVLQTCSADIDLAVGRLDALRCAEEEAIYDIVQAAVDGGAE